MIRLTDGLQSLSRNEDLAGACRQFLQRPGWLGQAEEDSSLMVEELGACFDSI